MSPELVLMACHLAATLYLILKVSFLAGRLTEKVDGLDHRVEMLEKAKQNQTAYAATSRG